MDLATLSMIAATIGIMFALGYGAYQILSI